MTIAQLHHIPARIAEPEPPPRTGVRRVSLCIQPATASQGDDAIGNAWIALYINSDGTRCAEVSVYPIINGAGEYDVTVCTMVGNAEGENEYEWPHPDDGADIS